MCEMAVQAIPEVMGPKAFQIDGVGTTAMLNTKSILQNSTFVLFSASRSDFEEVGRDSR